MNSPATGNWEDYIAEDVVSAVDTQFRTLARASARGITGHSMGGFGALSVALHRPGVFGAVYFGQQMTAAGVPIRVEGYAGTHQGNLGERISDHMLPFSSALLESQ